MNKLLLAIAALPLMAGAANAAQPLNDKQMDRVTAGFTSLATADAEGLVSTLGTVLASTATLSLVIPYASATRGETSSTLWKSLSAAASSTITSTSSPAPIPAPTGP